MQGIKLELFIFDTFPLAERVALLEVHRHEEFAPVKNAPGSKSDSPDTARQAMLKLHTRCGHGVSTTVSCQPGGGCAWAAASAAAIYSAFVTPLTNECAKARSLQHKCCAASQGVAHEATVKPAAAGCP